MSPIGVSSFVATVALVAELLELRVDFVRERLNSASLFVSGLCGVTSCNAFAEAERLFGASSRFP